LRSLVAVLAVIAAVVALSLTMTGNAAAAGAGPGPGPLKVPAEQLPHMLGVTSVAIRPDLGPATLTDTTLT